MSDETVEKVLERLDRLGELSGEGFEILIQQVYIESMTYLLWAVIMLIIIGAGKWYLNQMGWFGHEHRFHTKTTHGGGNEGRLMATVSTSVTMGVAALVFVGMVLSFVRRLINPEFWAIDYILRGIGS